MKRTLLLTLATIFMAVGGSYAQPELNIVWEKMIWPTEIKFAKFSKDGQWIYAAINNTIVKMNPTNGEFSNAFIDAGGDIYDMDISEDGNLIVTLGGKYVYLWSPTEEKVVKSVVLKNNDEELFIGEVAISADSKHLVMFSTVNTGPQPHQYEDYLYLYDIIKDSVVKTINAGSKITCLKYSPDGNFLAVGKKILSEANPRNTLEIYSADSLKYLYTLEDVEGTSEYKKFQFSNDGKKIATLKSNHTATIFNVESKNKYYETDNNRLCFNIELLPDSESFLIDYDDWNGNYETEYRTKDSSIQTFIIYSNYTTTFYTNDTWVILCGAGPYLTLLSNTSISVIDDIGIAFNIEITNEQISISAIKSIREIKLFDNSGSTIFVHDLANNPANNYTIENTLLSGTYFCTITTTEGKTYSKSFQVVR